MSMISLPMAEQSLDSPLPRKEPANPNRSSGPSQPSRLSGSSTPLHRVPALTGDTNPEAEAPALCHTDLGGRGYALSFGSVGMGEGEESAR